MWKSGSRTYRKLLIENHLAYSNIVPFCWKVRAFSECSMLKRQEELDLICRGFKSDHFVLKRIFRGSKDGFTAEAFHRLCDGKGPTLSVI